MGKARSVEVDAFFKSSLRCRQRLSTHSNGSSSEVQCVVLSQPASAAPKTKGRGSLADACTTMCLAGILWTLNLAKSGRQTGPGRGPNQSRSNSPPLWLEC
jgi:hypothetical protein